MSRLHGSQHVYCVNGSALPNTPFPPLGGAFAEVALVG